MKQASYLKDELYGMVSESREIFDFIQGGCLDGIWFWDIENPENEWMSDRFKAVFGYMPDEIENTSKWWQDNINKDDLKVALENFRKHCEDPSHPYDQVVRYKHKNGSTVWVLCKGKVVEWDNNNRPLRMIGTHTDLTQVKALQKLLETNSKMAAVGRVAGGIAHEINNPVSFIYGNLGPCSE